MADNTADEYAYHSQAWQEVPLLPASQAITMMENFMEEFAACCAAAVCLRFMTANPQQEHESHARFA